MVERRRPRARRRDNPNDNRSYSAIPPRKDRPHRHRTAKSNMLDNLAPTPRVHTGTPKKRIPKPGAKGKKGRGRRGVPEVALHLVSFVYILTSFHRRPLLGRRASCRVVAINSQTPILLVSVRRYPRCRRPRLRACRGRQVLSGPERQIMKFRIRAPDTSEQIWRFSKTAGFHPPQSAGPGAPSGSRCPTFRFRRRSERQAW